MFSYTTWYCIMALFANISEKCVACSYVCAVIRVENSNVRFQILMTMTMKIIVF
jgi:hypothetical protein